MFAAALSGAIASTSAAQPPTGTTKAPIAPMAAHMQPVPPQPPVHPDVVGHRVDTAMMLLGRFDVLVRPVDSEVTDGIAGTVARQSPPAGTTRRPNERIDTVWVRRVVAPPPIRRTRPDVLHLTFDEGARLLRDSGVSEVRSTSKRTGKGMWIAKQLPAAGTPVALDEVDTLVMEAASGPPPSPPPPPPRLRPSVRDSTHEWATGILRKYGASRIVLVPDTSVRGQRVDSQRPYAGFAMRHEEVDTLYLHPTDGTGIPWWVKLAAGLLAVTLVLHFTGALGPRFRVTVQSDPPALSTPPNTNTVAHDLTVKTVVGDVTSDLRTPTERIILREERRHDAS